MVRVTTHPEPLLAVVHEPIDGTGVSKRGQRTVDRRKPGRLPSSPQFVVELLSAYGGLPAAECIEHEDALARRSKAGGREDGCGLTRYHDENDNHYT